MELQIAELAAEGKVVLVDFWTYTCINCIRTLPYLRDWWAQYEDDGLVILGIHTPEFEFEKDYQNVADAIETHSVGWPVAQDNNMTTWRNFENRYWPAKYLYNVRGEMIYSHFGEGAYAETEERIRNAWWRLEPTCRTTRSTRLRTRLGIRRSSRRGRAGGPP